MIASNGHCGQILIKDAKSLTPEALRLEMAKLGAYEWESVGS